MSVEKKKSLLLSIIDYVKKVNEEASLNEEQIRENLASDSEFWNFVASKEDVNFPNKRKVIKKAPKEPTKSEIIKSREELWKCLDDPEHIDKNDFQKRM